MYDSSLGQVADVRLCDPASGHDLVWMVITRGQLPKRDVAHALRDILGEMPTAEEVIGWHPTRGAYEPMVQISVPQHLGRVMREGPGAKQAPNKAKPNEPKRSEKKW